MFRVDGRGSLLLILAAACVGLRAEPALAAAGSDATTSTSAPTPMSSTLMARPDERRANETTPLEQPGQRALDEVPRVGVVESAFGSPRRTIFAGAEGLLIPKASESGQGGFFFGGSPLPRLTLYGMLGRDGEGRFAPSATAQYAFLGAEGAQHALAALVQYKTEGFTEAGGELELGLLTGFHRARWLLNVGAVAGFGLEEEDEGEMDAEGKLRVAYDVLDSVRVGVLARFRERLAGERRLTGDRNWDFIGGPEVAGSFGPFMLSASGGPTTFGVPDGVGAYGMLTLAAVSRL
ncbi:MAG TPA: hypothetical protein VFQ35_03820 [Polyangiaceae bacterium]|nr:hypothetical protein [Polyangiaceae bacterium]